MKKVFWAISMMLLLSLLVACGSSDVENGNGEDGKLLVGVTNSTLKESVYVFMKDSAQKYCDENGVELVWLSSEHDSTLQMNQIENFIAQGVKCVTLESVRTETAKELVNVLHDAGIPVINLEGEIKGVTCDLRIAADEFQIGVLQVQKMVEIWGTEKPANVMILSGTLADSAAETLTEGVLAELKKYPNFNIVEHQYHNGWDRQLSMNTAENTLAKLNNDIQIVFGNNDNLMHGGLKACQNAGIAQDVLFFGGDFDLDTAEMILEGATNIFSVDRNSILQGKRIAEASIILAKGETPPFDLLTEDTNTPQWVTPITMVDSTNIKDMCAEKYPELM